MAGSTQPAGVVPSDGSVKFFGKILRAAYTKVLSLLTGDLTKDRRRLAILNQVEQEVKSLDKDVRAFTAIEVPAFYEQGMFESIKGLNERGSGVLIDREFANFHREAIGAMTAETYAHIAQGMTGITRTAEMVIGQATRESILIEIAKGAIGGDDTRRIRNNIKQLLEDRGIKALRDKAGREWDLNAYGEMLVRTKLTQAHNSGLINRMTETGYNLVQVSSHFGTCPLCAPYEGEILSINGTSSDFNSLDNAISGGLFHPNCRHTVTPYHQAYLDEAVIWDTTRQKYVPYKELRAIGRQPFKDILEQHNNQIKEIGLDEIRDFYKLIDAGKASDAKVYVDRLPDSSELKPSMIRLIGLI